MDKKCLGGIYITLTPPVYQQVKSITNIKKCWKILKAIYGENTEAMYNITIKKIIIINLKNYKDLPVYLSAFKKHLSRLQEIDSPLDYKIQRSLYKKGLPTYLRDYMFTLLYQDIKKNKEVNLDYITIQLK